MRRMFAVLAVVACSKKAPPPPSEVAPIAVVRDAVASDAALDAAAPTGPVELLHQYLAYVEVSSHVRNKTIRPEHLVDRDFQTAWNSKTGELAGTWLDVSVFGGAIEEVRLTVGHTGKGPKGEDYFAMNPRITKLSVLDGDKLLVTATLDPKNRALQTIKVPAPAAELRLRVDEVVMGTKKAWKEVCISELEAWGTPPADAKPSSRTPIVSVYEPPTPDPNQLERGKPVDTVALCDEIMKPLQEKWDASEQGLEDAPPRCDATGSILVPEPPWTGIGVWRLAYNEAHGPMICNLTVSSHVGEFFVGESRGCGPWDGESIEPRSARAEDVIPGGDPELVVEYATTRSGDLPIEMIVCRVAKGIVQCTKPWEIEGATWKVKPRFTRGTVAFDPVEGKPPPQVSGPQAIVFD